MRKVLSALLLAGVLIAPAGNALPRKGRGPARYEVVNSLSLAWTNSSLTCGQFKLGSFPGGRLWYDDNDACPGPVLAQATLTETGVAPFAFQLTIADGAAPNLASQVTLQATDASGAWITLHLKLAVDGQAYAPGTSIYPLSGMTAHLRVVPTIYRSSSAGCFSYGNASEPPNQTSCGHAIVAASPGATAGTTGQHQGYYQGNALLIASM